MKIHILVVIVCIVAFIIVNYINKLNKDYQLDYKYILLLPIIIYGYNHYNKTENIIIEKDIMTEQFPLSSSL